MTYNEKKALYESIMKDVAKTVKRRLNEGFINTDTRPFLKMNIKSARRNVFTNSPVSILVSINGINIVIAISDCNLSGRRLAKMKCAMIDIVKVIKQLDNSSVFVDADSADVILQAAKTKDIYNEFTKESELYDYLSSNTNINVDDFADFLISLYGKDIFYFIGTLQEYNER